jgi:hypothetical protein
MLVRLRCHGVPIFAAGGDLKNESNPTGEECRMVHGELHGTGAAGCARDHKWRENVKEIGRRCLRFQLRAGAIGSSESCFAR